MDILDSYLRTVAISRQFVPRLSFTCTFLISEPIRIRCTVTTSTLWCVLTLTPARISLIYIPTGSQSGDVLLFSTRSLTVSNVIQAHNSPLSFLALNSTGTLLATSSDKGTVIRVWSVPGAEKLYQFRRGTREAKVSSFILPLHGRG